MPKFLAVTKHAAQGVDSALARTDGIGRSFDGRRANEMAGPGGLPKRSNGSDCKSDGSAFAGSNPAPPNCKCLMTNDGMNNEIRHWVLRHLSFTWAGVAQW